MVAGIMTTPAAQVVTPHFAWPFRLGGDGAFAVVEQDTIDDIEQNVIVLATTQLGSRQELPEYGITDPTFTTEVDATEIEQAVNDWEERAVVDVQQSVSSTSDLIRNVRINTSAS